MSRYPLNLPAQLKKEAEHWADEQGVSLNQFIMWAVAEKVGALRHLLDAPDFPRITYRRGAAGIPTPILRCTGMRVQTLVVASQTWELTPKEIAAEYELSEPQVEEALEFYETHREEIDRALASERDIESTHA